MILGTLPSPITFSWQGRILGTLPSSRIVIFPIIVFSVLFSILILIGIITAIIVLRLVQIIFVLVLLVFLIFLLLSTKSPNIIEPHHTLLDVGGALLPHGKHQVI